MKSGLKAGVALAAMIAGVAAEGAPVQRAAPVSGRIVATKAGETAVLVPENRARRAEMRQDLKAGDVLRTNAGGTLAIVFADQTQIRLGRNAVLVVKQVTRGSPSSLQLQRGSMWARSPRGRSNLSVETPSATAAIRGTEWSLTADDDSSSLSVFSGEVEFANPQGSLSVTGGQAAHRVVLVNPSGREQMLYFVTLEDGLNLFGAVTPALSDAHQAALAGRWDEAEELYASIAARSDGRAKAIADHGRHIAAMQLGRAGTPPALDRTLPCWPTTVAVSASGRARSRPRKNVPIARRPPVLATIAITTLRSTARSVDSIHVLGASAVPLLGSRSAALGRAIQEIKAALNGQATEAQSPWPR